MAIQMSKIIDFHFVWYFKINTCIFKMNLISGGFPI